MRARYERFAEWLLATDPGLLRLRMASRVTLTLMVSLVLLYLLTRFTGQPVTVAMLGVVISMLASMAVNDPDPRRRKATLLLTLLPGAAAIALGALLAPYRIAGDVAFVAIMFIAVYVRRFGPRGMALGMAAFMTYFFALFLGVKLAQLPWFIAAIAIGIACSFAMTMWIMPDRPQRILQRTLRALGARIRVVIEDVRAGIDNGAVDPRQHRRLRRNLGRLNATTLMVESQFDDHVDARALWPGIDQHAFSLCLFDAELGAERLAESGNDAAGADMSDSSRRKAMQGLAALHAALAEDADPAQTTRTLRLLDALCEESRGVDDQGARAGSCFRELLRSAQALLRTVEKTRKLVAQVRVSQTATAQTSSAKPPPPRASSGHDPPAAGKSAAKMRDGFRPSTRQAIQVAVAASLAIIAGELISPQRWYWAVIASFVIFSGTSSRGETLSKGWQRLLGTLAGVVAGVLVATAVNGNAVASVMLIFVCMFCGFYLSQIAYGLMIFWITTMLALLYGLLGQFSVGLLLLRLEETAAGAVIGVLVAALVLPVSTRATVRTDIGQLLHALGALIGRAGEQLADTAQGADLSDPARELGRQLQQVVKSAKPMTEGIAAGGSRLSMRRCVHVLTACDHYLRDFIRLAHPNQPIAADSNLRSAIAEVVRCVRHNIAGLADCIGRGKPGRLVTSAKAFDAAFAIAGRNDPAHRSSAPLADALHALRRIDQAVVGLAADLGAKGELDAERLKVEQH